MRITPINQQQQYKNPNFKGAGTQAAKLSDDVLSAVNNALKTSFTDVLPKAGKAEKPLGPIYNTITDGIANVIGKLSTTKTSKKLVSGLNHLPKPSARMADLASFTITFFYVNNTRKSKKIEEERKLPMMINNISITVVSSALAALIDKVSDVFLDNIKNAFYQKKGADVLDNVIKSVPSIANESEDTLKEVAKTIIKSDQFKKQLKDYTKRVEKAKSLTIFSFVVRFLVTVLMGPIATKIVNYIKDSAQAKKPQGEDKKV